MLSDKLLILKNINVFIAPNALTNDNTIQASRGFDLGY